MSRFHSLKHPIAAIAAAALVTVLCAARADAATIGFSNAGGIIDQGHIDWSTYAPEFGLVTNGTTKAVPGIAGLNLTVSEQTGFDFLRVAEGTSWIGNFTEGDPLLYTTNGGPIDFLFSSPVAGFGSQIQSATFGAFTARIDAFNSGGVSLGSFTFSGDSNSNEDGSALFLGVLSDAVDISRVRLSLTAAQPDGFGLVNLGDFAVNDPEVTETPIPEPISLVLLGTGLVGAAVRRNRAQAAGRK